MVAITYNKMIYENPLHNEAFSIGTLVANFNVSAEENDDLILIDCGNDRVFMYYTELNLLSIDFEGERYDLPKPKLIGDFVADCIRLEVDLQEK